MCGANNKRLAHISSFSKKDEEIASFHCCCCC
jgi:hypothetical protein